MRGESGGFRHGEMDGDGWRWRCPSILGPSNGLWSPSRQTRQVGRQARQTVDSQIDVVLRGYATSRWNPTQLRRETDRQPVESSLRVEPWDDFRDSALVITIHPQSSCCRLACRGLNSVVRIGQKCPCAATLRRRVEIGAEGRQKPATDALDHDGRA